jgi:myo-inositol-1(or 4)-monophosphatase
MLETAIKAAKLAGEKLEYYFETILEHEEKEDHSLVTRADREADELIINLIRENFPTHQILTEENGTIGEKKDYLWVVDPLDGTLNFTRGIPLFSTSIAVVKNGKPIVGVVYNPVTKSLFHGEVGKGAFWNGEKIQVADKGDFRTSVITLARSREKEDKEKTLAIFSKLYFESHQRILGCSALELAYVASGRTEGTIVLGLNSWDVSAGVLLILEAGGRVTDFSGKAWSEKTSHFIASNGKVHEQILSLVDGSN